jgi:hypothetical protein
LISSCSSNSDSPSDRPDPTLAVRDYPPVMAGDENFADGKIAVQITLAMPSAFRGDDKSGSHSGGSGQGRHGGGGGGGGHHRGGGGGMGGGGPPPEGASASGDDTARPAQLGSTLPPAQLKLHLKNTSGTESIACEVIDFNSSLGDFAVFPGKYQLAAGESADSESMTSRLGVEGAEIPVTVALRIKDHVEKKVITLHQLPPPPPPADAAPSSVGK